MGKTQIGAIFAAAVIVTIVAADVIFFRHHAAERLAVNVGIVLVYAAFYWRFFKRF
ncbi:MAG: hypothetical protein WCK79_04010 [Actinomycetes bacterium]